MATQLIAKGDQNGDGMLTLDELKAGFKALRSERESAKSDAASKRETRFEKELANLFAVADTDSSGTLTKAELVKLLTALDQHRQASGGDGPPPPKAADGAPPPPPRGSRSGRP
jgi:Ca2+-binding EF-hand superfamily protein